jgi:hypothetical protein
MPTLLLRSLRHRTKSGPEHGSLREATTENLGCRGWRDVERAYGKAISHKTGNSTVYNLLDWHLAQADATSVSSETRLSALVARCLSRSAAWLQNQT